MTLTGDPEVSVMLPTRSMNEAIKLARGRWLAFLDGARQATVN